LQACRVLLLLLLVVLGPTILLWIQQVVVLCAAK
jgi:hypothetical protein